ncbi:hypothetical protein BH11ACT2_BH11ACT2_17390 [soil metagenome]
MRLSSKVDARVAQTRDSLVEAMLELLHDHDHQDVSISALCARADVSRPTFYQHFRTPDDVLALALEEKLDRVRAAADLATTSRSDAPAVLQGFLASIWVDRNLYRAMLEPTSRYSYSRTVVEGWLLDRIAGFLFPDAAPGDLGEVRYRKVVFIVGGITATIGAWLASDASRKKELGGLGDFIWASAMLITDAPPTTPVSR